jgi:hypothetical protein
LFDEPLPGPADPQRPARFAAVGVPTRDRPECLRRCLLGHLESARRHGRDNDFVVVDDAGTDSARAATRELLRELAGHWGANVFYAGPRERAGFAEALARRAGLPEGPVRFALLNDGGWPVATGASRNALLLHAAGDLLLQVDDDTLCLIAPAPLTLPSPPAGGEGRVRGARAGLAFSPRPDPTEFWFPDGDGPVLPPDTPAGADLLAVHEELLGKTVPGPQGGPVLATAAGVAGDSGMGTAAYFLLLDGASRARLLRSPEGYRAALTGRRLLRAATQATVCRPGVCMALNLGLDNRRLLPPFLPAMRNQDGVFAALLRACFPDALFGFLPWTVLHEPPSPRPSLADGLRESVMGVRTGQALQVLIGALAPGLAGPGAAERLRTLGARLEELGSTAAAAFAECLNAVLRAQMSGLAVRLEGLLHQHGGQPAYWADDMCCLLSALREALPQSGWAAPTDLRAAFDTARAGELFRQLVRQFGQLLRVWPDLCQAALDLRARGTRLAVPA